MRSGLLPERSAEAGTFPAAARRPLRDRGWPAPVMGESKKVARPTILPLSGAIPESFMSPSNFQREAGALRWPSSAWHGGAPLIISARMQIAATANEMRIGEVKVI